MPPAISIAIQKKVVTLAKVRVSSYRRRPGEGGPHGSIDGTVFELARQAGGAWTEMVLNNFNNNGTNCCYPWSSLIFDASGNLYGTTRGDLFINIVGTVFELKRGANGSWTQQTLHTFSNNGADGYYPLPGVYTLRPCNYISTPT